MISPSPTGAQYPSQGCQPLVRNIIHILILAVLLPFFRNNTDKITTSMSYQRCALSPKTLPSPNRAQYPSQGCQPLVRNIVHILILAVLLPFFSATMLTKSSRLIYIRIGLSSVFNQLKGKKNNLFMTYLPIHF
mgnify:CR=1 FL=1